MFDYFFIVFMLRCTNTIINTCAVFVSLDYLYKIIRLKRVNHCHKNDYSAINNKMLACICFYYLLRFTSCIIIVLGLSVRVRAFVCACIILCVCHKTLTCFRQEERNLVTINVNA